MSAADGARLTPSGRIRHAAVEILAALEDLSRLARPEACAEPCGGFVCGGYLDHGGIRTAGHPGHVHTANRGYPECDCSKCGEPFSHPDHQRPQAATEPATQAQPAATEMRARGAGAVAYVRAVGGSRWIESVATMNLPHDTPLYAAPPPAGEAVTWRLERKNDGATIRLTFPEPSEGYWAGSRSGNGAVFDRLLDGADSCVLRVTREPQP